MNVTGGRGVDGHQDAGDPESGRESTPVRTIRRTTAESENGCVVRLYRNEDNSLLTYEELYDAVDSEGSALPAEQWRDGYWNPSEYMVEACLVGIYSIVEALATVVHRADGTLLVEYTANNKVIAERILTDG